MSTPAVDGVLVVDKPERLTSHDVVAVARRALGQSRIGHTGTLDPFATGVLPLACGKATRLVRFMTASDKTYETTIRFGLVTDTYDVTGVEVARSDARPAPEAVRAAIASLTGAQPQTPPPFSAKHVDGRRAYELARNRQPVVLPPVQVHLAAADLVSCSGDHAVVTLTCSAGFYVRSFVHDLGQRLGMGACVEALRRTRAGQFTLAQAVTLDALDRGEAAGSVVPLSALLEELPAVTVTAAGRERLRHGQLLRPADLRHLPPARHPVRPLLGTGDDWLRVLDEAGALVGMGTRWDADGTLRPHVVLI